MMRESERRKQKYLLHIYTYQNKEEILITITFLIFATCHEVLTGISNYLHSTFPLLSASTSVGHGSEPGGTTPYLHS